MTKYRGILIPIALLVGTYCFLIPFIIAYYHEKLKTNITRLENAQTSLDLGLKELHVINAIAAENNRLIREVINAQDPKANRKEDR